MKKIFTLALLSFLFSGIYAQNCPANDSVTMGPGSGTDVYYSLKKAKTTGNGVVSSSVNNNWHLAISVQASNFPYNPANGVAIRVNSVLGENPQTGATGTKLVKLNGGVSNWRNVDTTGLNSFPELLDSDSTWNLSAFTSGYPKAGPFNFIWGTYNQSNKNIESNGNVYVLYNKSANWYKKINVKEVTFDTMWHIIIANIDNTDSVYLKVSKRSYPKRMFVYYNVLTKQLLDREPDTDQWDLVWTKYKAMIDFNGSKVPYSVTGVLSNPATKVAKNLGKKCDEVWLANKTAKVNPSISAVGSDWKSFTGTAYAVTDTFVYFITARDSSTYKVTMKSFTGGSKGKTTFNFYQATLGLENNGIAEAVSLYPNPSNGIVRINADLNIESISVMDLQGQMLLSTKENFVDATNLSAGIYLVLIQTEAGLVKKTLIKE
jgi:hypothetical protein